MFSRISNGMDAVKLASVFSKGKTESVELLNYTQSRDEAPERGLQQVGRNDLSDLVIEGPPKTKRRFELTETSA